MPEAFEAAERGELELGGCVLPPEPAAWAACGRGASVVTDDDESAPRGAALLDARSGLTPDLA
jgi:hypothetical protein